MYDHTVPPMLRTLEALSTILTKAEAHCEAQKIAPEVLLSARLFPDMLPFTRQIQIACDTATRAADRLTGAEMLSTPDTETSFAELQARIARTRDYLGKAEAKAFEGSATREVTMKTANGETTLTGLAYLTGFTLPNFYFHATTAYDILRHNGVPLGKRDFLGNA